MQTTPLNTFIIYASVDSTYKVELEKFLHHLHQKVNISKIPYGANIDAVSKQDLEKADLILLLISSDFYNFSNDAKKEGALREALYNRAKERFIQGETQLVPIIVRDCDWSSDEAIKNIPALPYGGQSIISQETKLLDKVYTDIAKSLSAWADRLLERKAAADMSDFSPPDMVFIEGGIFKMGNDFNKEEKPEHTVHVHSFRIGKYPVTFDQYDRFCIETNRDKPPDNGWGRGSLPVIHVSWRHAQEYCQWLSQKTGEHYRLPTEAEWEFAARGGNASQCFLFSGGNELNPVGWFWENSGNQFLSDFWDAENLIKNNCRPHSVGEKAPNELGIHDMSGNVWEWCADHWHDNYIDAPTDGSAWIVNGDPNLRTIRGGSWMTLRNICQITFRDRLYPGVKNNTTGFRLAQSLMPH